MGVGLLSWLIALGEIVVSVAILIWVLDRSVKYGRVLYVMVTKDGTKVPRASDLAGGEGQPHDMYRGEITTVGDEDLLDHPFRQGTSCAVYHTIPRRSTASSGDKNKVMKSVSGAVPFAVGPSDDTEGEQKVMVLLSPYDGPTISRYEPPVGVTVDPNTSETVSSADEIPEKLLPDPGLLGDVWGWKGEKYYDAVMDRFADEGDELTVVGTVRSVESARRVVEEHSGENEYDIDWDVVRQDDVDAVMIAGDSRVFTVSKARPAKHALGLMAVIVSGPLLALFFFYIMWITFKYIGILPI